MFTIVWMEDFKIIFGCNQYRNEDTEHCAKLDIYTIYNSQMSKSGHTDKKAVDMNEILSQSERDSWLDLV